MVAPVATENRPSTLPIFHRTLVGPGMDLKDARTFGAAVAENLMGPPAFEIAATPNTYAAHLRKFQRAIHPTAAAPFRRAHVPIRVIIEGDKRDRLRETPNPECSQIMKITGAVEKKWRRETRFVFVIKLGDQTRRCGEAQFRPPLSCVNNGQAKRLIPPRVIQVEMESAADQRFYLGDRERN